MKFNVITRSSAKRAFIESTADVYISLLKLKNSRTKVDIVTVSGLARKHQRNGLVHWLNDDTLQLCVDSNLNANALCQTMAHEMVHVKQMAKGQLSYRVTKTGKTIFTWLGKVHPNDPWTAPWEIEAYSRERILSNEILKYTV